MRKVYVREDYCVGCGLCQVYCATLHSQYPGDVLKAYNWSQKKPIPRLIIERENVASFAWQCRHCDDPDCVSACITGALSKDEITGQVQVNETRCIGCSTCVVACPFGAIIELYPQENLVLKCDLCQGRATIPTCVSNCPNEALIYSEGVIR